MGGVLKAGDVVDVVATFYPEKAGTRSAITKTIMQHADIVAVGEHDGKIESITLALPLEQVELLQHTNCVGRVSYVLVPQNGDVMRTAGVTNEEMCRIYKMECGAKGSV